MIVPYKDQYGKRPNPGDKVVLIRNLNQHCFFVTAGHVLTYVGNDQKRNPGNILKDEKTGTLIKHVSCTDYAMYEPDLDEAIKYYGEQQEKAKVINFLKKNCEKGCPINLGGQCNAKLSCLEELPEETFKQHKFLFNYLRKIKIRKIERC